MKFIVDTPVGRGLMIKAFNKKGKRWIRVQFSNKDMKRKSDVKVFLYTDCYIRKAPSRLSRWITRLIKKLDLNLF